MDDFELFRARSLHGGVLGVDQDPSADRRAGLDRRRGPRRTSTTYQSNGGSDSRSSVGREIKQKDSSSGWLSSSKFWSRRDEVIAIPEVVRCSNAWVDFSAAELQRDRGWRQKGGGCWQRPRNAWLSKSSSETSAVVPDDHGATEFDVYRLRSFTTTAGRIVNRGDYFRVRQRVHPSDVERTERLQHPVLTSCDGRGTVPSGQSNSPTSHSSNIEYRPVVYYAKDLCDVTEEEPATEEDDEEFSDEKAKLLADRDGSADGSGTADSRRCTDWGRYADYFSIVRQIRHRGKSGTDRHESGIGQESFNSYSGAAANTVLDQPSTNDPDIEKEGNRIPSAIRVVVLGDRGVGKTTLAHQLLTSEHLANRCTNSSCNHAEDDAGDSCNTVSVELNEDEFTVEVIDAQSFQAKTFVHSVAISACLQTLQRRAWKTGGPQASVILVANKNDLVRNRIITDDDNRAPESEHKAGLAKCTKTIETEDGRRLAGKRGCKFIEVSAFLDHRVDELLAGIVAQVRLRQLATDAPPPVAAAEAVASTTRQRPPVGGRRRRLQRLIGQLWYFWTKRCLTSCRCDMDKANSNCENLFLL